MLKRNRRSNESELFPGFSDVVEIGDGGFSTVYRAREIDTNRLVALKLLRIAPDVSEHALESFRRETVALGALSAHPNIVTLYRTMTTSSSRPVLVLELCTGSMAERVRAAGRLPVYEAVATAVKIAGALETAHRSGMLHRDVKPQNILITEYGEPALADFGVARLQTKALVTGGVFGFTTLHAAPELLEGSKASPGTDVYGLASTLYHLVAGQAAFRAFDGEAPAAVALRILRDPVQPILMEGVPIALSDLLVQAMSKEPTDRPVSAAAFADRLRMIESEYGWPVTTYTVAGGAAPVMLPGARIAPIAPPSRSSWSPPQIPLPPRMLREDARRAAPPVAPADADLQPSELSQVGVSIVRPPSGQRRIVVPTPLRPRNAASTVPLFPPAAGAQPGAPDELAEDAAGSPAPPTVPGAAEAPGAGATGESWPARARASAPAAAPPGVLRPNSPTLPPIPGMTPASERRPDEPPFLPSGSSGGAVPDIGSTPLPPGTTFGYPSRRATRHSLEETVLRPGQEPAPAEPVEQQPPAGRLKGILGRRPKASGT
ncbi:MAG TPA: protein kinase [Acidimicrobiales bacterium]|nr:protein kinase [Acidimicrobiales bacterium]